ncbi:hypothetical protein BS78_06G212200, partial [Paspalum vaginatum]
MYSGTGNVMLMVEIEDQLHNLRQGERSVIDYVAELKGLWADADFLKPIELPHSECVAWVRKWIDERRVIQFFRGLNPEFKARCSAMFHQPNLCSLEDAIAAITREESRLNVMKSNASTPSCPIFVATKVKESRECFNCGDTGHLIREYPKPLKANRGRGRGISRGAPRGKAVVNQHWKEKVESSREKNQGSYVGDFVNFAYTDEGNYAHASIPTRISQLNWILDSGASKHVTGALCEFESYMQYPHKHKETIQTADGTSQSIKGIGTVQCTPSIKLSSVLHVPAFPASLISLSALVDQLDCRVILDRENCLIQERQTGKSLGTATRHSGLWYMDREGTNDALCTVLAIKMGEKEFTVMLLHCRLGHLSFDKICKAFPDVMCG